jgi:hypothetical protein
MQEELYNNLAEWIDTALAAPLPTEIAAFHCNLYEGRTAHQLDIIGAPSFDPHDSDWASDDIFMSPEPQFEFPHDVVGKKWEAGLAAGIEMLTHYINSDHPGAIRIRQSQALSVGFVDGDLHLLWAKA